MATRVRQFVIHGVTESGSRFRPSDWAERLAGVMAQFRPPGCAGNHLTYSPYVLPVVIDGVRGIVVDQRLRDRSRWPISSWSTSPTTTISRPKSARSDPDWGGLPGGGFRLARPGRTTAKSAH